MTTATVRGVSAAYPGPPPANWNHGWGSPPNAPPSPATPSGDRVEKPGLGLLLVSGGLLVGLLTLLVLPWTEGGDTATFMDVRDALANAGDNATVSESAQMYVSWAAFATFGVVVQFGLFASVGVRSRATIVFRTLGVVAALGAGGVHYVGVWQLFYDDPDAAGAGPWFMYLAYGLILVGAALGPRTLGAQAPPPSPVPPGYWQPAPSLGSPGAPRPAGQPVPPPVTRGMPPGRGI